MPMTQEEAEALVPKWQKILRLQDWKVFVEIVRAFDLDEKDAAGQCDVLLAHRTAKILLRDPNDYTGKQWIPIDLERVLVHEMLHIHFEALWPEDRDTSCHIPEEQAINAIADALVELERRNA